MNNSILKSNAKANLQKNHWLCVAVAFFMTLGATGGTIPTLNTSSQSISAEFPGSWQEQPFNLPYEDIFSDPATTSIVLFVLAVAMVSIVISFVLKVFVFNTITIGGSRFFLKLRKNHPVGFAEIFENFKDKTFINIAKVSFIKEIYITLFTLLFIIPGVIKSYEYWAVNYILSVRPDLDHKEALRLSKEIMNGHKLDLFVLKLSFIGWHILSLFTCGLLSVLYVAPYMQSTFTEFFSFVREDALARSLITPYDIPDYDFYVPPTPTVPFYSTSYGINTPPQGFAQPQDYTQYQNYTAPQETLEDTPTSDE